MTSYQTNKSCNPKISIIVPIYKVEQYLPRCIDSILAQTFTDFELLLIDDGSPDNSGKICDEYAKKDRRVRVFHKENGGVSSARNLGLDNSKGKWIVFGDADDWFTEYALEILINKSTEADTVLGNSFQFYNDKYTPVLCYNQGIFDNVISKVFHFALWGYLLSSATIKSHHIRFVEGLAFSEDKVFLLEYCLYCKKMVFINEIVYVYRINNNSACRNSNYYHKLTHQFMAANELIVLKKRLNLSDINNTVLINHCYLTLKHTLIDYILHTNIIFPTEEVIKLYEKYLSEEIPINKFNVLYYRAFALTIFCHIKHITKKLICYK